MKSQKYLSNGAKGFIINQYWFDKHKDDKALLASEYKRLLKNWAGKQAAYIVSIPLDSVCTASERYKGFMKNLDDLEKEANEAKQAGSGNSTNTATSGGGGETNVPVTGITISPIRLDIPVGSTGSFTATVSPDNATNKTVNWSSDNPEAASVDSNGTVTGKESTGDQPVTITATAADGGSTATGKVIVSPNP